MNTRLPLLLLAATLGFGGLRAGDFSDHVPGGGLLYLELTDLPSTRDTFAASPMGEAVRQIDWKALLVEAYRMALQNESMDFEEEQPEDPETLRTELEEAGKRWDAFTAHLSGSLAFATGDFDGVVELFKRHGEIRETLYPDFDPEAEETPGEDPDFEAAMERERELDAAEMLAVMKEFRILADVRDGDALLDTLAGWVREDIQEQEADEDPLKLTTHDWDGLRVFFAGPDLEAAEARAKEAVEAAEAANAVMVEADPAPEGLGVWWTVRNGVLAVAFTEEGLRDALRDLTAPPATVLSTTSAYQDAVGALGERDFLLYFNPARLDALIRQGIEGEEAEEPGGMTPKQFMDWLGLDALLPYALATRMEPEGVRTRGRMGFSRETALSRILIDPSEEPAPTPSWLHKDYQQVSSFTWHLGRAWNQIEQELMGLAPEAAAGLGMGRMFLTAQLGFDIKLQFLDHLGGGVVLVQQVDTQVLTDMLDVAKQEDMQALMEFNQRHPTNGQYFLLALEMKNPDAISSALNTLMAKLHPAGAPEPEDFRGHPLHYPMSGNPQMERMKSMVSYTLLHDYLLVSIGQPELLRKAVTATLEPDARLWRQEEVLQLRDRLPPRATMLEFASGDQQEAAMKVLQRSLAMMASGQANASLPDFTPLGRVIENGMGAVTRNGLVFDVEGYIKFRPAE